MVRVRCGIVACNRSSNLTRETHSKTLEFLHFVQNGRASIHMVVCLELMYL